MSRPKSGGFTLVEVMVALAVVAIALPALLFTLDRHIDSTLYLRERARGQWVAANRIAELRLSAANSGTLRVGRANGETTLAGVVWHWSSVTEATAVPGFFRVDVRVTTAPDDTMPPVATLSAFLAPESPSASP